jgi:hypothetical protein
VGERRKREGERGEREERGREIKKKFGMNLDK